MRDTAPRRTLLGVALAVLLITLVLLIPCHFTAFHLACRVTRRTPPRPLDCQSNRPAKGRVRSTLFPAWCRTVSVRAGGSSEPGRLKQRPSTRRAPSETDRAGPHEARGTPRCGGIMENNLPSLRAWRSDAAGLTSCGVDRVVIVGLRLPRASGAPRPTGVGAYWSKQAALDG